MTTSHRPRRLTAAASLALALLCGLGATRTDAQSVRQYDAYEVRRNMLGIVDKLQYVRGTPFLDSEAREGLAVVRAMIESASDAELEPLAPVGAQLEELHATLGLLLGAEKVFEAGRRDVRVDAGIGDALPGAAYPDLVGDVSNLITAVVDVGDDFFQFRLDCIPAILVDAAVGQADLGSISVSAKDYFCGGSSACRDALGAICGGCNINVDIEGAVQGLVDGLTPSDLSLQQCKDSFSMFNYASGGFDTSAANGLVGQLESLGFQNLGTCDTDTRSSTTAAYIVRLATVMAEAARDIADKVCNQDIGALVGFNLSIACIPIDVLNALAKGIHDNLALCDAFIDSAEINGTFVRMEALHDQVADAFAAVEDLSADLGAHDAAVKAQLEANAEALSMAIDDTTTAVTGAIATHDSDIKTLLAANRAFFLGLELEEALVRRERDAVYYLPAANGGQLETARALVASTLLKVQSSGQGINDAAGLLAAADRAIAAGQFKNAFDLLATSYFEAVKVRGENLPNPRAEP